MKYTLQIMVVLFLLVKSSDTISCSSEEGNKLLQEYEQALEESKNKEQLEEKLKELTLDEEVYI
ncbi:MAG: hypothetical protein ACREBU_00815 [Nitrososphaera sp.]